MLCSKGKDRCTSDYTKNTSDKVQYHLYIMKRFVYIPLKIRDTDVMEVTVQDEERKGEK